MRYGQRRIAVLLKREGWAVDEKRVHRLYRELGLQMRNKTPKRRLGLDDQRSWIVLRGQLFVWPAPDIRPVPGKSPTTISYGLLPAGFFRNVRDQFVANQAAGRVRQVRRTD